MSIWCKFQVSIIDSKFIIELFLEFHGERFQVSSTKDLIQDWKSMRTDSTYLIFPTFLKDEWIKCLLMWKAGRNPQILSVLL